MARLPRLGAPEACVIGCGRRLRRDDQAGILIAERLLIGGNQLAANTRVWTTEAPCASLFADLEDTKLLILVDAARNGKAPAGELLEIDYAKNPERLGIDQGTGTHALSLATALTLAGQLEMLPPKVLIFALVGREFGYGEGLSPPVDRAIPRAAALITERIRRELRPQNRWALCRED